ncbi:hypothetical protein EOM09_06535, partial [bacterium]|nr:hypothetical protein [bacterium]
MFNFLNRKFRIKKPILLLIFNRPDTTLKVLRSIRSVKPSKLYVACDGPRKDKSGEKDIVDLTREMILKNIDWDCTIRTLFRPNNLGCRLSVSSAIDWFFSNEEDGIILEDDCLPNLSFYGFCEFLLNYYKDNKKIMHITGDNFAPNVFDGSSYYFSKIQHCWGWATWADRWKYYGTSLSGYDINNIKKFSTNENVQEYWLEILKKMKNNEIDSWAYQWTFQIIEKEGFCI